MDLLEFKDSLIFIENSRTDSQDYTEKKGGEGEQLKKNPLRASTHVHASYIHTKKENL